MKQVSAIETEDSLKVRPESAKDQLKRYIDQTNEIHNLASPQIRNISSADGYRARLLKNFSYIGELAKQNEQILENYFFPSVRSGEKKDKAIPDEIQNFLDELIDASSLNNLDHPLVYYHAVRMLQRTDTLNEEALMKALDNVLVAAYLMICITARLVPVSDLCFRYYHVGMEAGERLLTFLEREKFLSLSDEMKELVVIDARYIRVVSEIDDIPGDPEQRETMLERMKNALAMADDPFYREQLPNYNWDLHRFRTYEYIASLTDLNNAKGYDEDQLQYINACTKAMRDLCESGTFEYNLYHHTQLYSLFLIRNAYLAGETPLEQYKEELAALFMRDFRRGPDEDVPLVMLFAPLQYMLLLDPEHLTAEEQSYLSYFYTKLIGYMHQTPKKDSLTFLLGNMSLILKNFIEIPGGMDLETMGLSLTAALHPTTYVHTLSVANLTKSITGQLISTKPELFVGMPGYDRVEDVEARTAEIENYAYHAALCHDFGKLIIADTIMTYGRKLLDDEFDIVRVHPSIGAYLLARHASTAAYADVARGHHLWYNGENGYPQDFDATKSPYRTIISITACADCLDAATDVVGRSYKDGKTLDQFLEELNEGSGTRYAPYLSDLFTEPAFRAEIEYLITKGRAENYRKAYFLLKKNEETFL